MPSANPFAPVLEVGGGASAGGVSVKGGAAAGVEDQHAVAGYVLIGLVILVLLWKSKFRFSAKVTGG